MPIYNNDENKSYASSGVGTTALVLSSVATAAVTGLIGGGNGLSGLFAVAIRTRPTTPHTSLLKKIMKLPCSVLNSIRTTRMRQFPNESPRSMHA